MTNKLEGCIEQVLEQQNAQPGEMFQDDFGNRWVVHDDRDGFRLENDQNDSAWIPYWTASIIKLPGFRRVEEKIREEQVS